MKRLVISLMVVFFSTGMYSQDFDEIDSMLNYIIGDDEEFLSLLNDDYSFSFLYLYTDFDNRTISAGREIGLDQYNMSAQLFYLNSAGFYFGLGGAGYSQMDPKYSTTVVSSGYGKALKKLPGLRYRISYGRYFFNTKTEDYEPRYNSSLNAGITLSSKWLGTRIDASALFGNEFGKSFSLDVYSRITLLKFQSVRNKIIFKPEISVYIGNETVALYEDSSLFNPGGDFEPISIDYEDVFGYLNTRIELPISFSYEKFDFEICYQYNLPHTFDQMYFYTPVSSINFSIGYLIDL